MLKKFTLKNYKNFKDEISIDFENTAGYQFIYKVIDFCLPLSVSIFYKFLSDLNRTL